MFARLLLTAALLAATPAAAQTSPADPLAAAGDWIGKFVGISAEPAKASAICGPQLGKVIGTVRDSATARAAAGAVRSGWEQDKVSLRALVGGKAVMEPLIERIAPSIESMAVSGDALAASLQRAGRQSVVPGAEVFALLNALNQSEIAIAKSTQDFAQTLQTIGK